MKARIEKNLSDLTEYQIKKIVAEEYKKTELEHAKEFSVGFISAILYSRFINTNASTVKLRKEFDDLKSTFLLMENGICGEKFDVADCIEWVRNTLKIDLEAELRIDVEHK